MQKWFSLFSWGCLDNRQVLPERWNLHEHIAEKDTADRRSRGRHSRGSSLQLRELLLDVRRPGFRLRRNAPHGRAKRRTVSALGCDAAQFKKRRKIIRLNCQNLRDKALKLGLAIGSSLALDLQRELIRSLQIRWIQPDRLTQIRDGPGRISAVAFENAKQGIDMVVHRGQFPGA